MTVKTLLTRCCGCKKQLGCKEDKINGWVRLCTMKNCLNECKDLENPEYSDGFCYDCYVKAKEKRLHKKPHN